MAHVIEYYCNDCGFELIEDDRFFYYDEKSNETIDFMLLMSTVPRGWESKIRGNINLTYCKTCNRHVRVYMIREVHDMENPIETIREGIENHLKTYTPKLEELKEIKKREKYTIKKKENYWLIDFPELEDFEYTEFSDVTKTKAIENALKEFHKDIDSKLDNLEKRSELECNAIYVILDERDENEFDSEKITCPECGSMINKRFHELTCPRCGGYNISIVSTLCD